MVYIENNLIDFNSDTYFTTDSLIEENSLIVSWNSLVWEQMMDVTPCRFDKVYMDNDLTANKLYQVNKFNGKTFSPIKFYSIPLNKIKPFNDGNGRTSKILFRNNKIMDLIDGAKLIKMM